MKGRIIFLLIWSALTGVTLYSLLKEEKVVRSGGSPIATVARISGDAQVRPESSIIWSTASAKQDLFNNDYLATFDDSKVQIRFKDGRNIHLEENTQIIIRSLAKGKESLEIELLHGNVTAEGKGKNSKDQKYLSVKAGEKKFRLKDGLAALTISHERSAPESARIEGYNGNVEVVTDKGAKPLTDHDLSAPSKSAAELAAEAAQAAAAQKAEEEAALLAAEEAAKKEAAAKKLAEEKALRELNAKKAKAMQLAALAKPVPPPEVKPVATKPVKEEPPKFDLVKLMQDSKIEPQIISPTASQVFWSLRPLAQAVKAPLPIVVKLPETETADLKWRPLLAAFGSATLGSNSNLTFKKLGDYGFGKQTINVSLQELEKQQLIKKAADSGNSLQFTLKPGVEVSSPDGSDSHMTFAEPQSFEIRSIAEFGNRPIKLSLSNLKTSKKNPDWILQSKNPSSNTYWIQLKTAQDLPRFADLIAGATDFNITPGSGDNMDGLGIFIVKNHKIIGSVGGIEKHKRGIEHVRKTLDAEVIFQGPAHAYIGGGKELKALIKQKGALPERLYILNDGKFIGVSEEFLRKNPEVRKFLTAHTSAFFTEPIDVLSSKTDWGTTSH